MQNPAEPNQPHHLDGAPHNTQLRVGSNVKLVIQEIAKRFRPFNAPPPAVPVSEAEFEAREAEVEAVIEANEAHQAKELEFHVEHQDGENMVLTLREKSDVKDGQFFTSHNAPRVQIEDAAEVQEISEPMPRATQSGRTRRGVYIPARRRRGEEMLAISVKRQRRLKMKKHKYKKLMRKTRNLRRRQDKL